jgi:alginate O-acetyltransferase complex protein AlgI
MGQFRLALVGLIGMSMIFAAWRSELDMALILVSVCVNYLIGFSIYRHTSLLSAKRKYLLILGVAINVALLGYFKYSTFLLENINVVLGTAYPAITNYLPLGISFLAFQQIAYLVDVYRGKVTTFGVLEYGLFCSFLPKMVAGPIVRYGEFALQLGSAMRSFSSVTFAGGITLFSIGLFKKLVMADTLAIYANPIFSADPQGRELGLVETWGGVLAYTFQLYFDFSGYTDMALGLARLFGIVLPEKFQLSVQSHQCY